MPFDASVRAYLRAYQNEYRAALHGGQHTAELSFRVPMHEMFRRIAHDLNPAGTFDIILEPRNQGRMGRPDWRIQDRISLGVYGYIEAKGPSNEPFDTTPYRDQINRYLTLGHKLIITDGIDFVLRNTRIDMSPAERRQFYEKHIKHMTLQIDEDGNVGIELKRG